MTTEVIEYIEFKTQKIFFSYLNDSLDILETTMIFLIKLIVTLRIFFFCQKVNEIFILISINEKKTRKIMEAIYSEK